jgi:hypothetical protein
LLNVKQQIPRKYFQHKLKLLRYIIVKGIFSRCPAGQNWKKEAKSYLTAFSGGGECVQEVTW